MAPGSDDQNDAASSRPRTEETTTTKRQRLTTSTGTQTSPLPSLSSSSDPPGDSLHAPPLPTLPFELVAEILYRLPVKFLLQLQCVCKSWKSLISDPKFAKKHLRVSTTRHNLILSFTNLSREFTLIAYPLPSVFTAVTTAATQLEYPLNNRNRFDLLVGSCDGILCFAINQSFALLWNPSIRKFNKLPNLDNPRREGSYTVYGFGYDHFTDDYKVVAVFCYECESGGNGVYKTQVKVHTLSTNCWRRIQEFPSGVPFDESGKFVSGTVNWLASTASSSSWVIVSLDLGKECYQELLQPDHGGVALVTLTLGVLRDCLCILSHSDTFSDIWVMKEYGNKESWTKLFSVPHMGDLGGSHPYMGDLGGSHPYTKALYVSEDDQVLLESRSELVIYNSRDGTFRTPEIQNINGWMVPEVYIESLISPCT